jgi:hypothetical protein
MLGGNNEEELLPSGWPDNALVKPEQLVLCSRD